MAMVAIVGLNDLAKYIDLDKPANTIAWSSTCATVGAEIAEYGLDNVKNTGSEGLGLNASVLKI